VKLAADEIEPPPGKRFKSVDGVKTEIEPPLTPEEQEEQWTLHLSRMV
jgi:hypothetical protein